MRSGGSRVRVTAQLVDAMTASHLWAERYDRDSVDIFAVQDDITEAIGRAIEPKVGEMERRRAVQKTLRKSKTHGKHTSAGFGIWLR